MNYDPFRVDSDCRNETKQSVLMLKPNVHKGLVKKLLKDFDMHNI